MTTPDADETASGRVGGGAATAGGGDAAARSGAGDSAGRAAAAAQTDAGATGRVGAGGAGRAAAADVRLVRAAHPVAFPLVHALLGGRPARRIPGLGVLVADPVLVRNILTDTSFRKDGPGSSGALWAGVLGHRTLIGMDGPAHRRLRRALSPVFSPAMADEACRAALTGPLARVTERLRDGEQVDVVTVARDAATAVIAQLIGMPPQPGLAQAGDQVLAMIGLGTRRLTARQNRRVHALLRPVTTAATAAYDRAAARDGAAADRASRLGRVAAQDRAAGEDRAVGQDPVAADRAVERDRATDNRAGEHDPAAGEDRAAAHPGGGVPAGGCVMAQLPGAGISREQAPSLAAVLLLTGTETVVSAAPRALAMLVDSGHLTHLAALPRQARDEALREVVTEAVRLATPSPAMLRRATRARDLGPVRVRTGDRVLLLTWWATRLPGGFCPGRRPGPTRNLAFGAGAHQCLGMSLAEREIAAVLGAVLDAVPPGGGLRITGRQPQRHVLVPSYRSLTVSLR